MYWSGLSHNISGFIYGYTIYQCSELNTQDPAGVLYPVEIPTKHYEFWLMNFIPNLPLYGKYNEIFTCINKLTVSTKLIPENLKLFQNFYTKYSFCLNSLTYQKSPF